jgi:uncharacterized protein
MRMPDVNVLVYAHRKDEAAHDAYLDWLERLVEGPEPFSLSVLVAVGFVRAVTNPRIFDDPRRCRLRWRQSSNSPRILDAVW